MEPVVAVTGAAGSLGRVLLDRLIADPGIERIVALDRQPLPYDHPKVDFVEADVRDPDFGKYLHGCGALIHLAFIVETGSRDPALVDAVNIGGSQNVITAAARAGVGHIVYASSIAAYGFHPQNHGTRLTEDAPTRGNDDFYYPRTKAAVERWLDAFEAEHPSLPIARLRPSVFLGPRGDRDAGMLRRPFVAYLTGRGNPVHVTHEEDVAQAFHLALARRAHGAFNIATDDPLPPSAWPAAIGRPGLPLPSAALFPLASAAYRAKLIDVDPVWLRAGAEHPILVSTKKARRELKWRPLYDTTGAALRALAGRPTAAASRGVRLLFGSAAAITKARGAMPAQERSMVEMRGINGTVNLAFTGDTPSEWHVTIREGIVGFYGGLDPYAQATITMSEPDFYRMLTGELTHARATMTGRVRLRGEGNWGMLLGGIVGGFRGLAKAEGLQGLPMRAFSNLVLRSAPATSATSGGAA